jgi:hypothetical protein
VLKWKAVKAEPVVKAPESATPEPAVKLGVWPVFVVVTPSNPQPESVVPAAVARRRFGADINATNKAAKPMSAQTRANRGVVREIDLDMVLLFSRIRDSNWPDCTDIQWPD